MGVPTHWDEFRLETTNDPQPSTDIQGAPMNRVTGIGGIFLKADDPDKLMTWYETHLGLAREADGSMSVIFPWKRADSGESGMTVWALFPKNTDYFGSSDGTCMINYRVDDLDAVLAALREEGVDIDPR